MESTISNIQTEFTRDIRNSDNRLVCKLDESTGTIEIYIKGCLTRITFYPDGKIRVTHEKKQIVHK